MEKYFPHFWPKHMNIWSCPLLPLVCFWCFTRIWDFTGGAGEKESACQCRRHMRCGFGLWVGKIPWRRKRQSTPVFLPEESHGQRSLVGCCARGHKESDTTECSSTHIHTHTHIKMIFVKYLLVCQLVGLCLFTELLSLNWMKRTKISIMHFLAKNILLFCLEIFWT